MVQPVDAPVHLVALIGQLFLGAAGFWRAAPWKIADNLQAPRVAIPTFRIWTACVLGNGGDEFGSRCTPMSAICTG